MENSCNGFSVVLFIEEDLFNVVPNKWVYIHGETYFSYWPSKNAGFAVKKEIDPNPTWKSFHVKILGKYDTYAEAKKMEKALEHSSESAVQLGRGLRKHARHEISSDETNSVESDSEEIQPKAKYVHKNRNELSEKQRNQLITCFIDDKASSYMTLNSPEQLQVVNVNYPDEDNNTLPILNNNNNNLQGAEIMLDEGTGQSEVLKNSNLQNYEEHHVQCSSYKKLCEDMVEIKFSLKRILEKLSNLEKMTTTPSATTINNFNQLPLKSLEEIKTFEELINTNDELRSQFQFLLLSVGGTSTKNFVYRNLIRLMNNEVGKKCSWTGMKNNFKLKDLKIVKTLQDAAIQSFKCTEKEVELHVQCP